MSNLEQSISKAPSSDNWALFLPMDPDTPIPLFDAAGDTGKFVKGILLHPETIGKRVLAATDYYTPAQIMSYFRELYPKGGDAQYVQISENDYKAALASAGMPPKAQQELYENMSFMKEFGYYGKASLDESLSVSAHQCHEPRQPIILYVNQPDRQQLTVLLQILDEKPITMKDFMAKSKAFESLK